MKKLYKKFESLNDFKSFLDNGKTTDKYIFPASQSKENPNWYGTTSYEEADSLFINGDRKIANKITTGILEATSGGKRINTTVENAVSGYAPHVANYIAGRPRAMRRIVKQYTPSPVVSIVYNISVNGDVSANNMKEAAVNMLSAVKMIEDNGTRVNLYLTDISVNNNWTIGWALKIKSAGQPLNVLKAAYPLCHPSMLRRHSFRFTEITEHDFRSGSYGRAEKDVTDLCKSCGIMYSVNVSYYDITNKNAKELAEDILKRAKNPK